MSTTLSNRFERDDENFEIVDGSGLPLDPSDDNQKNLRSLRRLNSGRIARISRYALPPLIFFICGVIYIVPQYGFNPVSSSL